MEVLRSFLVAFFSILVVFKTWLVLSLPLPYYYLVLSVLPFAVITTLLHKGGKGIRLLALAFCCLLIVCGMLFIAMVISTFFAQEYDSVSPIVLAVLGIVGGVTFVCLKREKRGSFQHYT